MLLDVKSLLSGAKSSVVHLHAARKETVGFGVLVQSENEPIENPELQVEPFVGSGAAMDSTVATVYRMHPVQIDNWPGWHIKYFTPKQRQKTPWDVLVPLHAPKGGRPARISPNETQAYWVDIAVPEMTAGGTYSSRLVLKSRGAELASQTIELAVWPFALPDQADMVVIGNVDHRNAGNGAGADSEILSTMQMLREHRITPVLPLLHPVVAVDNRGDIQLDWESYDAVAEPLLSGRAFENRIPLEVWPLPLQPIPPILETNQALSESNSLRSVSQYLVGCMAHFGDRGWLQGRYVAWPESSEVNPAGWRRIERFLQEAHRVIPGARLVVPWCPQDLRPYGWDAEQPFRLHDVADIWCPPAQFYDPRVMADERAKGRQTWFEVDRPPFSGSTAIAARSVDVRVLTWQAAQLQSSAIFLGTVNDSSKDCREVTPTDILRVNPETLIYSGEPFGLREPVASVRLKYVRRAMQDAAYFRLLREHGLEHVRAALTQALAPYAGTSAFATHFANGRKLGWSAQEERFDASVQLMADEIIRKTKPKAVESDGRSFAESLTWRRFMSHAHSMHVEFEGGRLHLSGTPIHPEFRLEGSWTLENLGRSPWEVSIDLWPPEQWTPDGDSKEITVPVGQTRRVVRAMTGSVLTCDNLGHVELPYGLVGRSSPSEHLKARISLLAAAPMTTGIRVDGDLSDWAALGNNVAGDFRLISSGADGEVLESSREPKNTTFAFLGRTSESLLIGINCLGPTQTSTHSRHRKGVTYDDGIPVGEEMVEVLLDPHNSGSRLPSELYHIVVKRDGGDLAEQGIRLDPPVGGRSPWPVEMEVATR
ncbi:MAG: hypothetical protein AABZ47_07350, partial [Planctomycetota bacterium]